jgi:hypothetical protein
MRFALYVPANDLLLFLKTCCHSSLARTYMTCLVLYNHGLLLPLQKLKQQGTGQIVNISVMQCPDGHESPHLRPGFGDFSLA